MDDEEKIRILKERVAHTEAQIASGTYDGQGFAPWQRPTGVVVQPLPRSILPGVIVSNNFEQPIKVARAPPGAKPIIDNGFNPRSLVMHGEKAPPVDKTGFFDANDVYKATHGGQEKKPNPVGDFFLDAAKTIGNVGQTAINDIYKGMQPYLPPSLGGPEAETPLVVEDSPQQPNNDRKPNAPQTQIDPYLPYIVGGLALFILVIVVVKKK